ncbi:unnamed protein product [Ixodes hexagonus]
MSQAPFVGHFPGVWSGAPVKIASQQRLKRVRPCSSCGAVAKEMLALPCFHVLCHGCQWEIQSPGKPTSCPSDGRPFTDKQLRDFQTPACEALRLLVKCPNDKNGCTFVGELCSLPSHLSSSCRFESPNAVAPGWQACSCNVRGMCPDCSHQPATGQKTVDAPLRQEPVGEERPRELSSEVTESLKVQLQSMGRRAYDRPCSANAQLSSDSPDTSERAKENISRKQFPHPPLQQVLCNTLPALTRDSQGQPERASPQPQQAAPESYNECPRCEILKELLLQMVDLVSEASHNSSESISTITQVLHQLRFMPGNQRR